MPYLIQIFLFYITYLEVSQIRKMEISNILPAIDEPSQIVPLYGINGV